MVFSSNVQLHRINVFCKNVCYQNCWQNYYDLSYGNRWYSWPSAGLFNLFIVDYHLTILSSTIVRTT